MIENTPSTSLPHAQLRPGVDGEMDSTRQVRAQMPLHLPLRRFDRDAPNADLLAKHERRPAWYAVNWPYLYRFYDADRQPLYFGITEDSATRLVAHRKTAEWWPLAEFIAVSVYRSHADVEAAERAAIRHEQPRFNKAHKRGATYTRLHVESPPEVAAAQLFQIASAAYIAELAALLQAPERFPQPEPPPPARLAGEPSAWPPTPTHPEN
ncbi:GIY-YIG nuclease family protein [Streptomyces sp. NPDC055692]|uniref:GIY-YIG nuclease family protein n=1 Tax=Streptomyces sp. NPDC055692 TaxID=3155683 RepID=UPI003419A18B